MPKSKNVLSSSDVITNISKNIDKPNFLYNEILKFDDLYNKVKKHPVNFSRSIDCLSKFLILNAIYFLVVKKYFELSLLHFFMIPIFFVISLCWTIKKTKKSISKLVLMSNSKFYFYNNFLIIESEDCLEKIPYNKILFIKEGKTRFYFSTKSKSFVIEKDKINSKFNDFLNELIKQYKNIQEDSSDILFWDCLHKYMGNYRLYCINEKNEKNLTNYYHTKKFLNLFLYISCV